MSLSNFIWIFLGCFVFLLVGLFTMLMIDDFLSQGHSHIIKSYLEMLKESPIKILYGILLLPSFILANIIYGMLVS